MECEGTDKKLDDTDPRTTKKKVRFNTEPSLDEGSCTYDSQRCSSPMIATKSMRLTLERINTSGLKLPDLPQTDSSDCLSLAEGGFGCARAMPLNEVITSCARTTPIDYQNRIRHSRHAHVQFIPQAHQPPKATFATYSMIAKGIKKERLDTPSQKISTTPFKHYKFKRGKKSRKKFKHSLQKLSFMQNKLVKKNKIKKNKLKKKKHHQPKKSSEMEYSLKLCETIKKMTQEPPQKSEGPYVVKYNLSDVHAEKESALNVKTLGLYSSVGVQADCGLVVDREVMNSYVSVKVSEALYDMKAQLVHTEEQIHKVIEEKEKMEVILKEKMEMIRDGSKPDMVDKCVGTDIDANVTKSTSMQKKKRRARHHKTTQASDEDIQTCLKNGPYLQSSTSTFSEAPSEIEKVFNCSRKIEWLFSNSKSCARCHAMRPQVRFLRALKKTFAKYKPLKYAATKFHEGITPDEIGWGVLGPFLQNSFVSMLKLSEVLSVLPLESLLKRMNLMVVQKLKHLLSHLPFPRNLAETINNSIDPPQTGAMTIYLLGWKLKELIRLLRGIYYSKASEILPPYFRAEVVQTDRIAYRMLTFAIQGMRNTAMDHKSLNSHLTKCFKKKKKLPYQGDVPSVVSREVLASSSSQDPNQIDLASSDSDLSDDESQSPPKAKRVAGGSALLKGPSATCFTDSQLGPMNFVQELSLQQLLGLVRILQSQITRRCASISEPSVPLGSSSQSSVCFSGKDIDPSTNFLDISEINAKKVKHTLQVSSSNDTKTVTGSVTLGKRSHSSSAEAHGISPKEVEPSTADIVNVETLTHDMSDSGYLLSGLHHPDTSGGAPESFGASANSTPYASSNASTGIASPDASIFTDIKTSDSSTSASHSTIVSGEPPIAPGTAMMVRTVSAAVSHFMNATSAHADATIVSDSTTADVHGSALGTECGSKPNLARVSEATILRGSVMVSPIAVVSSLNSVLGLSGSEKHASFSAQSDTRASSGPADQIAKDVCTSVAGSGVVTSALQVGSSSDYLSGVSNKLHFAMSNTNIGNTASTQLTYMTLKSPEMFAKMKVSKPVILKSLREFNGVFLLWTFPKDMQSCVSKYVIYYTCNDVQSGQPDLQLWKELGQVNPLPVPMAARLKGISNSKKFMFSVKAIFCNGMSSLNSDSVQV